MTKDTFSKRVREELKKQKIVGIAQDDIDEEVDCYYFYVERFLKGIKTFPSLDDIVEACAANIATWY